MLDAAPEYTTVRGLKPDRERHQIFANIEPRTGYPLQGGKRVQLNMFVRKIDAITLTENLQTFLMPAIWVDEGIALNDDMIQMLRGQLFNILIILDVIHYTLIAGGLILLIVMLSIITFRSMSNRRKLDKTKELGS